MTSVKPRQKRLPLKAKKNFQHGKIKAYKAKKMSNFSKTVNIGKVMAEKLTSSGITDLDKLKTVGSKQALIELAAHNFDVCVNSLYALEGAIRGIRWHYLTQEEKQDLKDFYKENF